MAPVQLGSKEALLHGDALRKAVALVAVASIWAVAFAESCRFETIKFSNMRLCLNWGTVYLRWTKVTLQPERRANAVRMWGVSVAFLVKEHVCLSPLLQRRILLGLHLTCLSLDLILWVSSVRSTNRISTNLSYMFTPFSVPRGGTKTGRRHNGCIFIAAVKDVA